MCVLFCVFPIRGSKNKRPKQLEICEHLQQNNGDRKSEETFSQTIELEQTVS